MSSCSLLAACLPPLPTVNEYLFMVQARGLQIRENVRSIGVQVLEQMVRGAYSNNTGTVMQQSLRILCM